MLRGTHLSLTQERAPARSKGRQASISALQLRFPNRCLSRFPRCECFAELLAITVSRHTVIRTVIELDSLPVPIDVISAISTEQQQACSPPSLRTHIRLTHRTRPLDAVKVGSVPVVGVRRHGLLLDVLVVRVSWKRLV